MSEVRNFFKLRDVLEVDTPILGLAPVTDPNLHALTTQIKHFGAQRFYLQTSPEYYLKRLVAAYPMSVYQLGKVFRDDEYGRHHSPEFTMLEWYHLGFDEHALMQEISDLFRCLGIVAAQFRGGAFLRRQASSHKISEISNFFGLKLSYRDAFIRYLNINPHMVSLEILQDLVLKHVGTILGLSAPDHDTCLQLLMSNVIEPALAESDFPVFIYDFPRSQAALAQLKTNKTGEEVAGRFEVYWRGMELGNGYHELQDGTLQRQRFLDDLAARDQLGVSSVPLDEHVLEALSHGLSACSGIAIGFDRLLMILMGAAHIEDVLTFYHF